MQYRWRCALTDEALAALTASHGGRVERGWWVRVSPHSLGWVSAHLVDETLVGFVNLAWDGGDHAFLLDPKVRPDYQRRGVATELMRRAAEAAGEAGCEWLHVDFEERLSEFYLGACGFAPTHAGLISLRSDRAPGRGRR